MGRNVSRVTKRLGVQNRPYISHRHRIASGLFPIRSPSSVLLGGLGTTYLSSCHYRRPHHSGDPIGIVSLSQVCFFLEFLLAFSRRLQQAIVAPSVVWPWWWLNPRSLVVAGGGFLRLIFSVQFQHYVLGWQMDRRLGSRISLIFDQGFEDRNFEGLTFSTVIFNLSTITIIEIRSWFDARPLIEYQIPGMFFFKISRTYLGFTQELVDYLDI